MIKLFLFLMLISSVCNAGYERTDWGDNLKKIQKAYPNGVIVKQVSSETAYRIQKKIAGLDAILEFLFNSSGGLSRVTLFYGEVVALVDLRKGNVGDFTVTRQEQVFKVLKNALSEKYGQSVVGADGSVSFVSIDGKDHIMLSKTSSPGLVLVGYSEMSLKRNTEGL